MGCFSGTRPTPVPPNYGQITSSTLGAQTALAPAEFSAEANSTYGQPAYAGLSLENLNTLLYGTPGGTSSENYDQSVQSTGGFYDAAGNFISADKNYYGKYKVPYGKSTYTLAGVKDPFQNPVGDAITGTLSNLAPGIFGSSRPTMLNPAIPKGVTWYDPGKIFQAHKTVTNTTPAERGLLATTEDILNNQPGSNVLRLMNSNAEAGLNAGDQLTPDQQRMIDQQSLAQFAARGMSGSGASVVDSIMNRLNYGQTLLQQRQQYGLGTLGADEAAYTDPLMNILGRNIAGTGAATVGGGPSLFNPQAGIPLAQGNFNTLAQFAAAQPTPLQNTAAIAGLAGNVIGGVAGAMV